MKKTTGPLFEHACHEGNFGLYNTLVGARLEEKRAAEAALEEGMQNEDANSGLSRDDRRGLRRARCWR